MKTLKLLVAGVVVAATVAFTGCAQMGDNGLTGLGQVARNTCRQPMPVYTKSDMGHNYSK